MIDQGIAQAQQTPAPGRFVPWVAPTEMVFAVTDNAGDIFGPVPHAGRADVFHRRGRLQGRKDAAYYNMDAIQNTAPVDQFCPASSAGTAF